MHQAHAPQTAPAGTTDAELVDRARARDEAAIRAIMQANNRRLYRIARGILRNDSEAEDVVQETFLALLQRAGPPEEPERYCMRSFRNRALNYRRSFWRREPATHVGHRFNVRSLGKHIQRDYSRQLKDTLSA